MARGKLSALTVDSARTLWRLRARRHVACCTLVAFQTASAPHVLYPLCHLQLGLPSGSLLSGAAAAAIPDAASAFGVSAVACSGNGAHSATCCCHSACALTSHAMNACAEPDLLACNYSAVVTGCTGSNAVKLSCNALPTARIAGGTTNSAGRLEIYHDGGAFPRHLLRLFHSWSLSDRLESPVSCGVCSVGPSVRNILQLR